MLRPLSSIWNTFRGEGYTEGLASIRQFELVLFGLLSIEEILQSLKLTR